MTGAGVVGIERHRSSEEKDVAKDAAVGSTGVRSRLVLAGAHPHSLRLARSCASIDDAELRTWSCDVRSLRVVRPGTVEARIRLPAPADEDADADPRYVGEWRLLIGGEGLGDDPETAAAIGTLPRAPIAARFACPYLSMPGVDDCGFVDESFFVALGDAPTLRDVCERAAEWLEGRHVRGEGGARGGEGGAHGGGGGDDALNGGGGDDALNERSKPPSPTTRSATSERSKPPSPTARSASSPLRVAWLDAAAHTRRKSDVIDAFRAASASSSFASAIRIDATFARDWFVPAFRPLVDAARRGDDAETLRVAREFAASFVAEAAPGSGVFSFDLLEPSATKLLTACVDAYERSGFPRRRPNTMNDAGAVVNEIGLDALMDDLLVVAAAPLARALYGGTEIFADSLDHHHAFVVRYEASGGGDAFLDMHHDASEVTLNVCLGRDAFEGSGLRFCGRFGSAEHRRETCELRHAPGRAVIHLGRQRHGADVISAGERVNLIVWARSSAFRAAAAFGRVDPDGYPRAKGNGEPDRLCLSRANDDDYERKIKAFDATTGR